MLSAPVAALVRDRAATLDIAYGDYLAAVLSEASGLPWTAPAVVREAGGLDQMLSDAGIRAVDLDSPTDAAQKRERFVVRPALLAGETIRAQYEGSDASLARFVADIVEDYHRQRTPQLTLISGGRRQTEGGIRASA